MAYEKVGQVAKALYEKSTRGEVKWEATSRDNVFQASFASYSVLSGRTADSTTYLQICNNSGTVIEEMDGAEGLSVGFNYMDDLFEQARRKAMGVDQALDEILNALETSVQKSERR